MTPPAATAEDGPDAHRGRYHLTILQGWRQFTTAPTATPPPIDESARSALSSADQARHDEDRLDYHTRMAVVATSTLQQVIHAGRRLTLLNRHAISARGLILSGPAGTGKTTAITQFGKTHEAIDQRRHPGLHDGSRSSTSPFHPPPPRGWSPSSSPGSSDCP